MITMLKQDGELFGNEELEDAFGYLVGKKLFKEALPKDFISAEEFASDLLGFEEFEEGDEEMDQQDAGNPDMAGAKTTGMMGVNEVIPEEDGF
jgi:hypothetical protein